MRLLQHTVRNQAERRPEAVALVFEQQRVTYQELEESSNRLARILRETGCKRGDRVALLVPKSVLAIVGMLGSLKAGCIYVPIDTASPPVRLARMFDACEPQCILAAGPAGDLLNSLMDERSQDLAQVGWLESTTPPKPRFHIAFSANDLAAVPSLPVACDSSPEDVAHILFTSGSTGVPKGVMITHSNVAHFLEWAIRDFGIRASDRISCHSPLPFDLSTFDVYGTFWAGAQLHLVPPEISLLPHRLADFIRRSELTQWFSVPSVLRYMAQFDVVKFNDFPSLERLPWCGEAISTPTLIYWMKRLPNVTFTNLYGPTEATIASSYYTVPACPRSEQEQIPIGVPCEGEELLVLDELLQPVPPGQVGDLYIKGVGLSPGYWRDPQKTEAVFLTDTRGGGRMYRTGDLARVDPDGVFYLLGRTDSQVKSRGYRIELGEIEIALHGLDLLRDCAVVAVRTDNFEGTAICCAYVPEERRNVTPYDIRQRLAEVLPFYMIPSQWRAFPALPLNANGKIDRPRLREEFLVVMNRSLDIESDATLPPVGRER